jgi:lipopolysaccharide export system permease protein
MKGYVLWLSAALQGSKGTQKTRMSLIERYMFRRIGLLALGALTVTTGIALTTQVLLRVDLLASTGQSLLTIGELALYLIPGMIAVALPFAVLISVLQTMRAMNQDSELVVLEASGSGILQRVRPALLVGAIGTAICLVITVWLEPVSSQKVRDLLARASGDLLSAAIQSGTFKQVDQGLFIQIAEKLPNGAFGGIFVSDKRDPASQFSYIAKTGSIVTEQGKTLLVVNDGQIQRKNISDNTVTFIKFDTYSLDAGTFAAPGVVPVRGKERPTTYLINPDVNDPEFQRTPEKLTRELHRRFSDPLYALALALIAVYATATAQSHRQGGVATLTLAASIGFFIRAFGFVLAGNGGTNIVTTGLMYGFPVFIIGLFSFLLFSGSRHQWMDAVSAQMAENTTRILAFFERKNITR